ncbi:outer membrane protein [Parasphingorhabdus cellanae]|uniref:Porin family protein n=1 Tax=Parasphingorhabdus cellanae TaxID=2806553 RepID=A0ABX7T788_9SPHN|nr:outer membrane beta-barrel protein [Parasphingorhabdus cellanae]QTD57469.1 porin family protein [Parasphingorhabdus cellanae]
MKSFTIFTAACVLALPVAAAAQSNDKSPFNGPFVGIEGSLDANQARNPKTPAKTPPTTTTPASKKKTKKTKTKFPHEQGMGGRIFAGYDVVLGDSFLIGVEAGIGTSSGAMTLDANGKKKKAPKKTKKKTKTAASKKKKGKKELALAAGEYRLDPGLTYDATARIGFLPSPNFLVYGRGGYRWLQTKQSVGSMKDNKPVTTTTKVTEKGFTYGGGAEFAVSENFRLRAEFNRTNFSKNFKQNKFSVGATVSF